MKKKRKAVREKSAAQIYLEKVEKLDVMIDNKLIERQQWRELAFKITANMDGEKVQTSGSKSKMADAVEKCLDMAGEIGDCVDRLIAEKMDVVATIEQLYSPSDYRLLHARYIQHIELKDIAVKWGKDYTTITTAHGRALKHVQDILDKKRGEH